MKQKILYNFGDWVRITGQIIFYYSETEETQNIEKEIKRTYELKPLRKNFVIGRISGASYRFLGIVNKEGGSVSWEGEYDYEPGYLAVTDSILVYSVKEGLMNKEYNVISSQIIPCTEEECKDLQLPIKQQGQMEMTPDYKKMLSECAKDQQRDAKGRFIKMPKATPWWSNYNAPLLQH